GQGRTDNSWGPWVIGDHGAPDVKVLTRGGSRGGLTTHGAPRAIGDHGALCPCPNSKKPMKKGTRGISWAPY
ncbi:unnamed protein product, partial [Staurois parvus]